MTWHDAKLAIDNGCDCIWISNHAGRMFNSGISTIEALNEISRVGKKAYVVVESYKNDKQLFNLQCWALTCSSFFSVSAWKWIFKEFNYKGDYEFTFFN